MSLINLFIVLLYIFYPFQEEKIFGIQYLKPYYLIFGVLLSVLIILTLKRRYFNFSLIYFYFPYTPFLLWICLSVIWSVNYENSIYACSKYLTYFLIGVAISYCLVITRSYEKPLRALYFSALIISALYIYTFIKKGALLLFTGQATMSTIAQVASINVGFGGGRNLLASWVSFALTFSFPFFLIKYKNLFLRILLGMLSFLLLLVIFLTLSRTAMLSIFICIIIMTMLAKDERIKKLSFSLSLLGLLLVVLIIKTDIFHLGTFLITRFTLSIEAIKGEATDYGTMGRLELWNYALRSFFDNPVLGSGVGTLYKGIDEIGGVHNYHNIFLQFLAQTGLVGLFLFLIWTCWLFYVSYSNSKFFVSTEYSFLSNLVFVNILVYYFKSLLMFQYFDLEIWTLIGFTGALYCYRKNVYRRGV